MPSHLATTKGTRYRSDIDGLRAVAVLSVVFDHLRMRFSGGYIGVDVFFVISGYLISAVILTDLEKGLFSFAWFYERRIRRIFPALFSMLAVTTLLAYRYLAPSDLESYSRSLLAALFSVSNLLFWHQAGYFDAPSAAKPLLHTWSLAVEEQFYIFFPILLVLVRRWFPKRLKEVILGISVLSFALACFWVRRDATTAFFLAPLRAWELLLGTMLSQSYLPEVRGRAMRNAASLLGILLILIPALAYTAATPFPGLAALPPCLGAALIIAAGENGPSLIGTVLSWRPFVFIGLISYSLYLWHWPILVFQNSSALLLDSSEPNSRLVKIAVLLVSLLVASASWLLVETPFRQGRLRPDRRTLFLASAAATASISVLAVGFVASRGMPSRFSAEALQVSAYGSYHPHSEWREGTCFLSAADKFSQFDPAVCLHGDSRRHVLLLGDSLAAHLYSGLSTVYPEVEFWQANAGNCLPFVNEPTPPVNAQNCLKLSAYIFGNFLLHHHPDEVLLSAHWGDPDLPELEHTVAWLQQRGMKVTVFGQTFEYDLDLPRVLFAAIRDKNPEEVRRHWVAKNRNLDREIGQLARQKWRTGYISEFEDLCGPVTDLHPEPPSGEVQGCPIYAASGVPLIFDRFHLTAAGSVLYARAIRERHQIPVI